MMNITSVNELYKQVKPKIKLSEDLYSDKGLLLGEGVDLLKWHETGKPEVEKIYFTDDKRPQHFGCFGTTGCGKTSFAAHCIKHDILKKRNLLILEPKGDFDLLSHVIEAAIAADRLEELLFVSPIYPEYSLKINLLEFYKMPDELIDHVAGSVRAKEPYFVNVAYEISTAIILGLIALAKARGQNPKITFLEVKKYCDQRSLQDLLRSMEYISSSTDPGIKGLIEDVKLTISQIIQSPQDFFAKVSSSLRTILTAMSTSTAGQIFGKVTGNEFIRRIENGEGVILFCNTGALLARRPAQIIPRVLVSMVQACMGRLLHQGKRFEPPLCLYLDEAHNVLYYGIQEIFNKGRAANLWIHFYTQSFAQVVKEIGEDEARAIVDNISTWAYMRVNSPESTARIEQASPEVTKTSYTSFFESGEFVPTLRENNVKLITSDKVESLANRMYYLKMDGKYYIAKTPNLSDPAIKIQPPPDYQIRDDGKILEEFINEAIN